MAGAVSLVIFLAFLYRTGASYNTVPALLWTNNMLHKFPQALAGHTTQTNAFLDKYIHKSLSSKPQNLIVFLQDKLNLDDITQHATGDTFQNIKSQLSRNPSAHLSGVASPADAIEQVKHDFAGRVHTLSADQSADQLDLSDGHQHMVVVDLPASSQLSRSQQLEQADRLIGSVMSRMNAANKPYTAVYTARQPSHMPDVEVQYRGRHLLATEEAKDNVTFLNVSGCLFFYATKIKLDILRVDDKESQLNYTMPPIIDASYTDGECNSSGPGLASLTLSYNNSVPGLDLFELKMLFKVSKFSWEMTNVSMTYKSSSASQEDVTMATPSMYQPLKFCYHCNAFKLKQRHTKNGTTLLPNIAQVSVSGLQLQVGRIVGDKFGRVNDCIPFFTAPIWSGLIVSTLLLAILALGVGLLADMNIVDRFDNPKGKTITVNVNE